MPHVISLTTAQICPTPLSNALRAPVDLRDIKRDANGMTASRPENRSAEDVLAAIGRVLDEVRVEAADSPLPPLPYESSRYQEEPKAPPQPAAGSDPEDLKRRVLIHNEKTKLTATATNTTAVALFGGGFVLPIVGLSFPLAAAPPPGQLTFITMIVWALVAGGLHWWARSMLEGLR